MMAGCDRCFNWGSAVSMLSSFGLDSSGSGTIECTKCDGSGTMETTRGETVDCNECGGSGTMTCPDCNGSGRIDDDD